MSRSRGHFSVLSRLRRRRSGSRHRALFFCRRTKSQKTPESVRERPRAGEIRRNALSLPRVTLRLGVADPTAHLESLSEFRALVSVLFPVHRDEPGTVFPVDHEMRRGGELFRVERACQRLDSRRLLGAALVADVPDDC